MKKKVYRIYSDSLKEFTRSFLILRTAGFVYRDERLTTVEDIIASYGYGVHMVLYAHKECKMIIMSQNGDGVPMYQFEVVDITAEEFIKQGLHIV